MLQDTIASSLTRTTARLLAAVFTVMFLLFIYTGFLTRAYHREKTERAEREFQAAERLASEQLYAQSIEHYAAALRLSRDVPRYKQALGLALIQTDRTREAEAYLTEVVRDEPSNGVAMRALARTYAAGGDSERASEMYQRAVYGIWPEDPVGNRVRTHFEFIEWLAGRGENVLVEAELLRLLEEVPEDIESRRRVGRMFLDVGSPEDARDIFAEVTSRDSGDCSSLAGLGDAEFDLANYLSARTAYRRAASCEPEDLQSQLRLALTTEIIDLDPTGRGLSIRTRVTRSRTLIERALLGLDDCFSQRSVTVPQQLRDDAQEARLIVERQVQRLQDETVEQNITLAERLHQALGTVCPSPAVRDEALVLVLQELEN